MKRYLNILLLVYGSAVYAQSVDRKVIASSGKVSESGGIQLAWTLGENAIQTAQAGNIILTQGFHQPSDFLTTIPSELSVLDGISVYPNPTSGTVSLKGLSSEYLISLRDMAGRLILSLDMSVTSDGNSHKIDLSPYPGSVYFLSLKEKSTGQFSSYRLIKVQ